MSVLRTERRQPRDPTSSVGLVIMLAAMAGTALLATTAPQIVHAVSLARDPAAPDGALSR